MITTRRRFIKQAVQLTTGAFLFTRVPSVFAATGVERIRRSFYTMGTMVTITAYGESQKHLHAVINKAQEEFHRLDSLLSVYKKESEASKINAAAGRSMISVDPCVIEILQYARSLHKRTDGAFNVCIEPLMKLWGFRNETGLIQNIPSDREIYRAVEAAVFRNLIVDEKEHTAGLSIEGAAIDLGGIAVGYSVDRAAEILRSQGVENALINHSGDILTLGSPPEQEGWLIEIPDPRNPSEMIAGFTIKDQSISTSGNYASFVVCDQKEFGHILNPYTGYPSESLLSFSAVCPSSIEADATSTACFVKGLPEGDDVVKFVAVTGEGRVVSSGL